MTEAHDRHLRTHKRFDGTECGYTTPSPGQHCRKCGCVIGATADSDRPWLGPTSREAWTAMQDLIDGVKRLRP